MSSRGAVYYSLSYSRSRFGPDAWWKLETSVRTLRAYNGTVPVVLFLYDAPEHPVLHRIRDLGVDIRRSTSYEALLSRSFPRVARFLSLNHALHRFIGLEHFKELNPEQLLYLDTDTLFFDNVEVLFDAYGSYNCCAREEQGSRRHYGGYRPGEMIDEDILSSVADAEGVTTVAPFNCGVILFDRDGWQQLAARDALLVDYGWRLMTWMALNPQDRRATRDPEGSGVRFLQAHPEAISDLDAARAIEFPSHNRWLMDEVALWLTLGDIEGLTYADFSPDHVVQNGELFEPARRTPSLVCAHYFSHFTRDVRGDSTLSPPPQALCNQQTQRSRPAMSVNLPIADAILDSPLVTESGGFAIYEDLIDQDLFWRLCGEAMATFWAARHEEERWDDLDEGRGGHPRQCRLWGPGGPTLTELYQSQWLSTFLSRECGLTIRPTGERGSYGYYTRPGDFVDLHLDVDDCDMVLLTALCDNSEPNDYAGSLVVYPAFIGRGLSMIRARPEVGARAIKLRVGQSIAMFGGIVPHFVSPVRDRQARVMSVLCFRAATS